MFCGKSNSWEDTEGEGHVEKRGVTKQSIEGLLQ